MSTYAENSALVVVILPLVPAGADQEPFLVNVNLSGRMRVCG